jgi:hypothetical protein
MTSTVSFVPPCQRFLHFYKKVQKTLKHYQQRASEIVAVGQATNSGRKVLQRSDCIILQTLFTLL